MMKLLFVSLAFGFSFLFLNSCHERGPLFPDPALGLGLRDFSCTEAWIEVQVGNNDKTANIYLKKNDEIIQTIRLGQSDSLFYFDNLLPNTSYKFDAVTYDDGTEIKSNPVTFTTLDTTSHNFTWQTFTFGQHSNSVLYDVAIINENNIWAVGEIYMNDSLGNPDTQIYNAVHWNGQSWERKRIQTLFRGNLITVPLEGIYTFSSTDIWTIGSLPIHGDGTNWIMYDVRTTVNPNLSLSKAWGVSSKDIYFVGRSGSIAHYNGSSWTKIESGINETLQDIYGFKNAEGKIVKHIAANNQMLILDENDKLSSINLDQNMILLSLWGKTTNMIYTAGYGVWFYRNYVWRKNNFNLNKMYRIKGNDYNDIYGVSSPGNLIYHFNGYSWSMIETELENKYWSLNTKNSITVAVGYQLEQAVITIFTK